MTQQIDPFVAPPTRKRLGSMLGWLSILGLLVGFGVGEFVFRLDDKAVQQTWIDLLAFTGNLLFLGPLKALLVPIVACSILGGIASMGNSPHLKRVTMLTLGTFWILMIVAAAWGAIVVAMIHPGDSIVANPMQTTSSAEIVRDRISAAETLGIWGAARQLLTELFTSNPIAAAAEGRLLPIVAISIALGMALAASGDKGRLALDVSASLFAGLIKLVGWILCLAPIGVASLTAASIAKIGAATIAGPFLLYILTVVGVLLSVGLIVLPIAFAIATRRNPFQLLWAVRPALLTAFSSASSGATIPITLSCMPAAGIQERVARFVIPFGTAGQLIGTAAFQAAAVVFLFQTYGIPLHTPQLLVLIGTTWLAAMSCAGIPSAAIVAMVIVIEAVNGTLLSSGRLLPTSAVVLILGMDRLMDMFRTCLNVWGHVVVAGIAAGRPSTSDLPLDSAPARPAGLVLGNLS